MAAVVHIPGITPATSGAARGTVRVEHRSGTSAPGFTGEAVLLGVEEVQLDDAGNATLTLAPCAGPLEGTIYVVTLGARQVKLQPITDGEWTLGTEASLAILAPPGAPSVSWVQGPAGGTGYVDTLAGLPPAAGLPDGTLLSATDDNGGTLRVADSGVAVQMAPSVNDTGGRILQSAAPTANADTVVTTGGTFYRVAGLTTPSFTMPSRPVIARVINLRAYNTAFGTGQSTVQIRQSTDGWSTSTLVAPTTDPTNPAVTPLWLHGWFAVEGYVTASPGATVQVALWITHPTNGVTMRIPYDDAAGIRPMVYAQEG